MTNYAYIWYNIQVVCILECSDVREIQKGKKYEKEPVHTRILVLLLSVYARARNKSRGIF